MSHNSNIPAVYAAIASVMSELSQVGIAKDRRNLQQQYAFRGIDDIYNALSPIMSKHGLVVLPRVLDRQCVERQTSKGSPLFYVVVDVEFDFVASSDGSKHTIKTFGEAMDSADKATNKAMSAAYKYACLQAFCIPTEGDNDADMTTHEVAAKPSYEAITPYQAATLRAELALAGVSEPEMCARGGVESLDLLPAQNYDKALEWLDKRKQSKGAAQQ